MNLVRAGHLHTPLGAVALMAEKNDCSTATVANVNDDGTVNVGVLDHMGLSTHGFTNIPVVDPIQPDAPENIERENTFHLSGECPWKR